MNDPHDDTHVLSGSTDGAQMESTPPSVPRQHGDHRQEDEGSPAPTSSSSAPAAARTLDTAATEEPSFTVEAAAPSAQLQSPTPQSARPEARSPGQQVFRMAFDGGGPPTPSPFNGSVSRMEVDDTRAEDQTCHSNDETEPLPESQSVHFPHALSAKIPTSDLVHRQNVGPNELSGARGARTPGQTRQARDGRQGPPGGAWAGPGAPHRRRIASP